MCDKGFIGNPSNFESECDKSCDVGEYLDYENWKCRKKRVDKLVEECTKTVEEVKLAKITLPENENKHRCSLCILYIVLLSIRFTVNIDIWTYFVYFHWYLKKDVPLVKFGACTQTAIWLLNLWMGEVKQIVIKNRTYYFYNDMINLKDFDSNLLKIDKKHYKGIIIYCIGYITIKKIVDYENIYSVNPLRVCVFAFLNICVLIIS